ncbi:hypothetical protein [Pseudomonas sp. UMAB-40]|uniref:hypothetical protein n=1 Tax=Pseudomonas sp. UMAB-40 TaxID=1365407 RepID=UPI001C56A874|nr:hypothetical protein [Pseudomonas sp. UMAB-40]
MQFHRQEKQNATQPTIKTEVNTMQDIQPQTPMQFAFSESEYRSRCQNAKGFYESRIENPSTGIVGAIVEFNPGTLVEALELYHQYRAAGWLPLEPAGGLPTAMLLESPLVSFITLYLKKPARDQERDLVKVCKQVRADYEAELEAALNAEIDRQVALALLKDERDRLHTEEQQRLNREQEVRDDLDASRAKLRDELIKSGRLTAEGNAQ